MSRRKVSALTVMAGIAIWGVIMAADADKSVIKSDISYDSQKSQFEQAMDHASDSARGDPQAMEKAAHDGNQTRDDANVGHGGQLGPTGLNPDSGPSVGDSISKDNGGTFEGHVRLDTDKSTPAAAEPTKADPPSSGAGDGSDRGGGDFHDGGYAGPDHGDFGNTV